MRRILFFIVVFAFQLGSMYSQGCCSGGSGSPIAGGASQGVLQEGQMELMTNYQYLHSNRFMAGDRDTVQLFDNLRTDYLYGRVAYGITKNFTVSLEAGYFLDKIQTGLYDSVLRKNEVVRSSGIADLIIFPRYDILNQTTETRQVELTLGAGYKFPLGKYNDSMLVYTNPTTGRQYFTTSPPLVQPTTGSQDFIGYAFFYRGFPQRNFRLFANALYIHKGWNPLGEKFGDYASVGLFAGKSFFKKLGITFQLKGEHIGKMKAAENMDLLAYYNVDTSSTGSMRVAFVPQVSFSYKSFTVFGVYEIPLYQYVNGTQIASRQQVTLGISYRFFVKDPTCVIPPDASVYYMCPMKCKGSGSTEPGICKECGMELQKVK